MIHQCVICGRLGTRCFEPQGTGGWICSYPTTCWQRRRSEQRGLRQALRRTQAKG